MPNRAPSDPLLTLVRTRAELAALKSVATKNTSNIAYEIAPDPNNEAATKAFAALPFERRLNISRRINRELLPEAMRFLQLPKYETQETIGGYLNEVNPSFSVTLDLSVPIGCAQAAATFVGKMFNQDPTVLISEQLAPDTGMVRVAPDFCINARRGDRSLQSPACGSTRYCLQAPAKRAITLIY